MKNLQTFQEFILERYSSINERRSVDIRKWSTHSEIAPWMMDEPLTREYMEVDFDLEDIEMDLGLPDWDLASAFVGSEPEAYTKPNGMGVPNPDWLKKKRAELEAKKKKIEKDSGKAAKRLFAQYPYAEKTLDILGRQNLGIDFTNVNIESIGPNRGSVVIGSWNGVAKITKKEVEAYGITMEQFIATILSVRRVGAASSY